MMATFPTQVQDVIDQGYEFRFGDYISKGFDIINKDVGLFIAFTLVYGIINWAAGMIPIAGDLANALILSPCLTAGYFLAARIVDSRQSLQFGDFFKGFDWLVQLLVVALIQIAIFLLIAAPILGTIGWSLFTNGFDDPEAVLTMFESFAPWMLLLLIPVIYFGIVWSFAPYLIVFHDMEAWPAMEASRQIISQKFFIFLIFGIVTGIIAILGVLGLVIALLYTVPAVICMHYACFAHIVGFPEDHEDEILDHLVV